jgi:hypothetical protein
MDQAARRSARSRSRGGNGGTAASGSDTLEARIDPDKKPWRNRIGGVAVVGYLLMLLYTFRVLRFVLPRVGWVTRLDQRWTDLWMR